MIQRDITCAPYKSVAAALLFSVFLGPIGLLYASFWAGLMMIVVGAVVVSAKLVAPIILLWIICCIFSVGAVEHHNKKVTAVFTTEKDKKDKGTSVNDE
jgi:hypothetical protein